MEITEVRIYLRNEERLKAYVSVTFDRCFAVRNMKVVQTPEKLLVSMPSRKMPDGTHKDIAHPVNQEMRDKLEKVVLEAYHAELKKSPAPPARKSSESPLHTDGGQARQDQPTTVTMVEGRGQPAAPVAPAPAVAAPREKRNEVAPA